MARKLYPYVRSEQKKSGIAPAMERFINAHRSELEDQGNRALNGTPGRMSRNQAKGDLRTSWSRAQNKGANSRAIKNYVSKNGGSRGRAEKRLVQAHSVSFGADPKRK